VVAEDIPCRTSVRRNCARVKQKVVQGTECLEGCDVMELFERVVYCCESGVRCLRVVKVVSDVRIIV
jgi:hypothetical protein